MMKGGESHGYGFCGMMMMMMMMKKKKKKKKKKRICSLSPLGGWIILRTLQGIHSLLEVGTGRQANFVILVVARSLESTRQGSSSFAKTRHFSFQHP